MTDQKIRVFLVDDHELFRAGVRSEIGDAMDIVGDADDVDAAIELITERRPDVVLLDVHMPGGGGRAVLEAVPGAEVGLVSAARPLGERSITPTRAINRRS